MRDSATYSRQFVAVTGRLARGAGGFALVDEGCPGAVLLLKQESVDILGVKCEDKERKFGLTCLFESTTQSITVTISGIYWPASKTHFAGAVQVWAVSDVSVAPTPN